VNTKTHRPWRRWVVLGLMVTGFLAAGYLVPVQPEISVKAENLLGAGVPWFSLPWLGDVYLVNTLPTLALTVALVFILAWATNRALKRTAATDLVPRGIGNLMEAFFELLYGMTENAAGSQAVRTVFPWFATIMLYVLLANLLKLVPGFESIGVLQPAPEGHPVAWLGGFANILPGQVQGGYVLVPFFRGVSVDLNFTLAIALISVLMTQVVGIRAQGAAYFSKFFNVRTLFKTPFFGAMDFLVGLLELVSELSKVISFAFRLFGNMFAGVVLVAITASLLGKISIVPSMLMLFELFVGVIQAFVFGMLTMVFMSQAARPHAGGNAHAG
jgi:F-type H+-transporting ATPase subunit a